MGIVRVSGRGQFVCHGSVVMAGWRCPEADASSRWLIVIRTDLFLPTPTMIAVRIRMCAARAIRWRKLIGQTDPFGTPAKPPLPLQSRANVRPQYAPAEEEASAPAGPPPWRQRARQEAPPQQEYEEPEPEYQPSPVHPLHRYAAPPAAASEQDHHEPQQDADEQPADPSRYDDALYGPIKSVEQENAGDPAYPDDPYAYQRGYEEEPEPRKRSSGMVTVAAVLALAVVGTGAAFALSNLCWLSAQRRAADHHG